MKKEKNIDLEDSKSFKEEQSEKKDKPLKKEDRKISFDAYFQQLMMERVRVFSHHKVPMRKFAEARLGDAATKKEFDELFKKY